MAERIVTGYRRLFEVRVLHHYWLDEGLTVFDNLPDQTRTNRLFTYDVRSLLTVAPTSSTTNRLNGLGCVFKPTPLGWIVAVPAARPVPDDALFEFALTVARADLFNYTALLLPKRPIYELYYEPEQTTYRYKENVPVLSNLTGVSRGAGANRHLFLSKEIPALTPADRVESLVQSGGGELLQLTSDQPGATTQSLSAQAGQMPVFMHQADVLDLVPPAGLLGAPARGVRLHDGTPDDVFALVRIAAVRPGDPAFSCTVSGLARADPPVFEIRLKNRSTVRQYRSKTTQALIETEAAPLPLTQFGNAGPKQKPPDAAITVMFDAAVPTKITRLVSEVFL